MHATLRPKPNRPIGINRLPIVQIRKLPLIDNHTRARYQNQRETVLLRRKLATINLEQNEIMSRLAFQRHNIKTELHQIQHEIERRELNKKRERRNDQNSSSFIIESEYSENSQSSNLESPSLLVHDLNSANDWEKSFVLPNIHDEMFNRSKPLLTFDALRLRMASKLDSNSAFFERSESILSNTNFSLRDQTEQMKRSVQIAMARSNRNSSLAARRNMYH